MLRANGRIVQTYEDGTPMRSATTVAGATIPGGLLPGQVDCRTAPGTCSVVIAAAADTRRSALLAYAVRG